MRNCSCKLQEVTTFYCKFILRTRLKILSAITTTNMKLISLILIKGTQGILLSVGITILLLFAILFAVAFLLSMSLHRLRYLSQTPLTSIEHINTHNWMKSTYKSFNALNIFASATQTRSELQIKN